MLEDIKKRKFNSKQKEEEKTPSVIEWIGAAKYLDMPR